MQTFFRNLIVCVLPLLLRLVATQIEEFFSKGGDKIEGKSSPQER